MTSVLTDCQPSAAPEGPAQLCLIREALNCRLPRKEAGTATASDKVVLSVNSSALTTLGRPHVPQHCAFLQTHAHKSRRSSSGEFRACEWELGHTLWPDGNNSKGMRYSCHHFRFLTRCMPALYVTLTLLSGRHFKLAHLENIYISLWKRIKLYRSLGSLQWNNLSITGDRFREYYGNKTKIGAFNYQKERYISLPVFFRFEVALACRSDNAVECEPPEARQSDTDAGCYPA